MFRKRKEKWVGWLIGATLLCLFSSVAAANISVYPMLLVVGKGGLATLDVYSQADEPAYVQVTLKRLRYAAGTAQPLEEEVPVDEEAVLAVPVRLVLPAGAKRRIRLIAPAGSAVEEAYRVYVETVAPPEDEVMAGAGDGASANVSLNIVWGALLFVPPLERRVALVYDASSGELVNEGNVHLRVVGVGYCKAGGGCESRELSLPPMFPGARANVEEFVRDYRRLGQVFVKYESRSAKEFLELRIP